MYFASTIQYTVFLANTMTYALRDHTICMCPCYACLYNMHVSMLSMSLRYACVHGRHASMVCMCLCYTWLYGMHVFMLYACLYCMHVTVRMYRIVYIPSMCYASVSVLCTVCLCLCEIQRRGLSNSLPLSDWLPEGRDVPWMKVLWDRLQVCKMSLVRFRLRRMVRWSTDCRK